MIPRICISCIAAFALMVPIARGQAVTATTNPVGAVSVGAYNTSVASPYPYIGLQGGSDTFVSLPVTRPPVFVGVTSAAPTGSTIPISGTPNWTTNQFVKSGAQTDTFYVLIGANSSTTNPKVGCLYTITGNDASDLSVNLAGDTITSIPAGSTVTVVPFWTLGTVFPASSANVSFTPSPASYSLETSVLLLNNTAAGINHSTGPLYYYVSSGSNIGWRLFSDNSTTDHSTDPLPPNTYFIVRNAAGTPTLPLVLTGSVQMGKVATPLMTQTSTQQDNNVIMIRPVPVTLANSGLNTADGSFVASPYSFQLEDTLLFYNNGAAGYNKSSAGFYFYYNGGWRLFGDSLSNDHGSDILPAGSPLVIRKAATSTGNSVIWTNTAAYTSN
jgi:uncharacterized protein (TIGR02597 family)